MSNCGGGCGEWYTGMRKTISENGGGFTGFIIFGLRHNRAFRMLMAATPTSPYSLVFADKDLEQSYLSDSPHRTATRLLSASVLCVLLSFLFVVFDLTVYPSAFLTVLPVRIGYALLMVVGAFYVRWERKKVPRFQLGLPPPPPSSAVDGRASLSVDQAAIAAARRASLAGVRDPVRIEVCRRLRIYATAVALGTVFYTEITRIMTSLISDAEFSPLLAVHLLLFAGSVVYAYPILQLAAVLSTGTVCTCSMCDVMHTLLSLKLLFDRFGGCVCHGRF